MRSSIIDVATWVGQVAPDDGLGQPVDADEARRRADEILSRAEFQPEADSFLDRVLGWIGEQISRIFFEGGGGGARDVIAYLLVLGVVGLVGFVVYKSMRLPGGGSVSADPDVTYGTETIRTPAVWLAEAERLAAEGDVRGALRCRHQALVATWITEDVIDHVVGRTAAECHAAVDGLDQDLSRRVVDEFEAVWYGGHPVEVDEYRSFAARCDRLAGAARPVGAAT